MNFKTGLAIVVAIVFCGCVTTRTDQHTTADLSLKGKPFNNITLEVSLKPFKANNKADITKVAGEMFRQWASLLRHTDTISIMLWTSDGSEILDYKGRSNQPLEWAKYMGNPNTKNEIGSGPKELSLHERAYLYIENPPMFTYGDLKFIVKTLKRVGYEMTGKPVRVGSTFDPGPEFAKSDFKYKKHPEILAGNAMGVNSFVSCYSALNADKEAYAGYPKGIPANTPFGTFFGRQSQSFLHDMGFDFLWFSNGFGFGIEAWSSIGAAFNGKSFDSNNTAIVQYKNLDFWKLFRKECPKYPIQTRGTNLSAGTDIARDGVDLRSIYKGGFNILPPPNSPWAALDGDFGMELVGYMSRISELPDNRYLFRYYIHDPWWVNSPWFDRYGSEPHDIYLPMSVGRIDSMGTITLPTNLNFLSIDNSYGNMPKEVPDEVIPHILKARYDAPTESGPFVWVYPFDEYHDWAFNQKGNLPEIYFGDWFIRQAINNGFPINTVISTRSFEKLFRKTPGYFKQSTLLSIVPSPGTMLEHQLMDYVKNGGKLILYGPADRAGKELKTFINMKITEPLSGEFQLRTLFNEDVMDKAYPNKIVHRQLYSGGDINTTINDEKDTNTHVFAKMSQGAKYRDVVWTKTDNKWNGGKVAYIRGTNSSSFTGGKLLTPDDPLQWFSGPVYLRYLMQEFGYSYLLNKQDPSVKSPVLSIARSNNAFYFSGYVPNTTVTQKFKFPLGAPVFTGYQTLLKDGFSTYNLPTSWHKECRVFIKQANGIVSCKEVYSGDKDVTRRIEISGLKHATLTILPDPNISDGSLRANLNSSYPWKTGRITLRPGENLYGKNYFVEDVSGTVVVAW